MQHVMPWFAQGRDAADGTLSLRNDHLDVAWEIEASRETMEQLPRPAQEISEWEAGNCE